MNASRAALAERQVRLTVDDYLVLDASGALKPYGRTELIDGVILPVSPQHLPHGRAKMHFIFELRDVVTSSKRDLAVMSEISVDMRPHGMPMPDVFLSRVSRGTGSVPVEAVALIVEVSSSTQDVDAGPKAQLYAEQKVPEYWLVDIIAQNATRMWQPTAQGYARQSAVSFGERLDSATLPGVGVDTAALL